MDPWDDTINSDYDEVVEQMYNQLRSKMDKYGWAVVTVNTPQPDNEDMQYVYTVGLHKWNHPELIVYGLPPSSAQTLVNCVAGRIADGEHFPVGSHIHGAFTDDVPIQVLRMTSDISLDAAPGVHRFFDSPQYTAECVQLVWPLFGKWPWDGDTPAAQRQPFAQPNLRF